MSPEAVQVRIKAMQDLGIGNYTVLMDNGHIYNNDPASVLFWNHKDECLEFIRYSADGNMAAAPYECGSVEYDHIEHIRIFADLDTCIKYLEAINPDKSEGIQLTKEYFSKKEDLTITGSIGDGVTWDGKVYTRKSNGADFYAGGNLIGGSIPKNMLLNDD